MSIKHAIVTSGFLLIEVITACTLLTAVALPMAYYQWYSVVQSARVSHQITLLLSFKNNYEQQISSDTLQLLLYPQVTVTHRLLPALVIDDVPLQPVCYEGCSRIGNKEHIYTFISTVFSCS